MVLDLSEDRAAVNVYCLLRDTWWPHPAHGHIEVGGAGDLLVFRCGCGEQIAFPMFVAHDLGLIRAEE
jgi:hypothetical protein